MLGPYGPNAHYPIPNDSVLNFCLPTDGILKEAGESYSRAWNPMHPVGDGEVLAVSLCLVVTPSTLVPSSVLTTQPSMTLEARFNLPRYPGQE